jgi:hypothetical protein
MTAAPTPTPVTGNPLERRLLPIGTAVVLHVVVLVGAAVAQTAVTARPLPGVPLDPMLVALVGLLLAHASLSAIWWAHSTLPSYAKTLAAALACAGIWLLLIGLLAATRLQSLAAASWAISVGLQATVTALGASLIELARRRTAARSRFTILALMLWTAVIGVLLGGGRRVAESLGWQLDAVLKWDSFYQLQSMGLANAVLALSLLAAIRLPPDWSVKLLAAILALGSIAVLAPLLLAALFPQGVGESYTNIAWLLACQGLFLLAALVPQQAT